MPKDQSWIGDRAFGDKAGDLVTIRYKSHDDAVKFVRGVLAGGKGVGLLEGPAGSGKTIAAKRIAAQLSADIAVALVDGTRMKSRELLLKILGQFGYDTGLESVDGLMKMVNMFAVQQTRANEPPLIIIDNADKLYPGALRTLNTLAAIDIGARPALRLVLTGGNTLGSIVEHEAMVSVAKRNAGSFLLKPMSLREGLLYLHARLNASGVNNADTVFPVDVCDRLYQQSGGWPGLMNRCAIEAITRAGSLPVRASDTRPAAQAKPAAETGRVPVLPMADAVEPPLPGLIITKDGELLAEVELGEQKTLVGRSDFADVVIDDEFASKMHLVVLRFSDALVLLDLNSANGTTVNSVRVRSTILKSDDIISLGHHRIKILNAPPASAEIAELMKSPDTVKLKHLVDIRRKRARQAELSAIEGRKQR